MADNNITNQTHEHEQGQGQGQEGNSHGSHGSHGMNMNLNMSGALQTIDVPDQGSLDDFKNKVKLWLEIDNQVKKLQAVVKERNGVKNQLTGSILGFMARYNIEDLNTAQGKLRYKVSTVKAPLNQKIIKGRLAENFDKARNGDELTKMVFDRDIVVQKHSLRRIKGREA